MSEILYRRMGYEEINDLFKTKRFIIPMNNSICLPRKWFTTSILKAQYFKNPYYFGETGLIKVRVSSDYYKKIFAEGKYVKNEILGYSSLKDYDSEIVYAKSHKTVDKLYNIGISNLNDLNEEIEKVEEVSSKNYEDIFNQFLEKGNFEHQNNNSLNDLEFYVQCSQDIAIFMANYQTLMTEAINPIIKVMHFDKNLDRLRKKNFNRFTTTLKVRFDKKIISRSLFNKAFFSVSFEDVLKISPLIENVEIVSIDKTNNRRTPAIQVKGDNLYKKHDKKEFNDFNRLSFKEFEIITLKMFKPDFTLDQLFEYLPNLKDVIDINQVNPSQIDNLKTHIEKSIIMSNLIINHFSKTINLDPEMMMYLKWTLLMHDLGKPYCECENISTRFSQFGENAKFRDIIINQVLDEDIAFPILQISKIFKQKPTTKEKKITKLINNIIDDIKKYYQTENAEEYLVKFINVAFLAKVSHTATLKTRTFPASYVDDLMFFNRIKKVVSRYYNYDFKYDEYYYSLFETCDKFIASYYYGDKVGTIFNRLLEDKIKYEGDYDFEKLIEEIASENIDSQFDFNDDLLLSNDSSHSIEHAKKVGILSYILASLKGLSKEEKDLLILVSQYHDIGRVTNDEKDHSIESVRILKSSGKFSNYNLNQYLFYLIEAHGFDDELEEEKLNKYNIEDKEKAKKLLSIFKDADALDRVRFDFRSKMKLNENYLRNPESKRLIKFACALNDAFKVNERELNGKNRQMIPLEQ